MKNEKKINSRCLAALLSSLVSQLVILLSLIFPSSSDSISPVSSTFPGIIFPLLYHLLSTSEIVVTLSLLSYARKRKRAYLLYSDVTDDEGAAAAAAAEETGPRPGKRGRVQLVIPQNPDSFKQFFNMKVSTFEWLCGLLEPLLECRDPVDSPLNLSAEARLGIGLFRLATGADYREISGQFRVPEPVSKFCVKHLCRVLCTNFRFWVGFPSQSELGSVSTQFQALTGLPNCCGVITRTRLKIRSNNGSNSISRSGVQEEGIAAQIVVDSNSRILSIIAGFRSNKSDTSVLISSTLYKDIEKGVLLNSGQPVCINDVAIPQYLVGDGDYPLLPWLVVPFRDPKTGSDEEYFNNACHLMRVSGLKAVASLRKWSVLDRPVEVEHKIAVAYVGACSILHNMLLMREDFSAFCSELESCELHEQVDNSSLEENLINDQVTLVRSALATRAREFQISHCNVDPSCSLHR